MKEGNEIESKKERRENKRKKEREKIEKNGTNTIADSPTSVEATDKVVVTDEV